MPVIDLATGARLDYVDTGGDKPPVILVHGLLGTGQTEFPTVIEWLRADYRVLAPSLRGYGKSLPKPRRFLVDFYQQDANDIIAFMNALNLAHAAIFGHSDGGEATLIAAGQNPQRFKAVVVTGALGYFGPTMRPYVDAMLTSSIEPETLKRHAITDAEAFMRGWVEAVKSMIDAGGRVSIQFAEKITAPLLLMLGDQDFLNPAAYGRAFVQKTPHGRFVLVNSGHNIHENAFDQFQKHVGPFLASNR